MNAIKLSSFTYVAIVKWAADCSIGICRLGSTSRCRVGLPHWPIGSDIFLNDSGEVVQPYLVSVEKYTSKAGDIVPAGLISTVPLARHKRSTLVQDPRSHLRIHLSSK